MVQNIVMLLAGWIVDLIESGPWDTYWLCSNILGTIHVMAWTRCMSEGGSLPLNRHCPSFVRFALHLPPTLFEAESFHCPKCLSKARSQLDSSTQTQGHVEVISSSGLAISRDYPKPKGNLPILVAGEMEHLQCNWTIEQLGNCVTWASFINDWSSFALFFDAWVFCRAKKTLAEDLITRAMMKLCPLHLQDRSQWGLVMESETLPAPT